MPLLDLKTDLKSLKYGADRLGGGDSGLPYIKTDINKIDQGFNRLRLTKFDDGLIRGGAIGALNASVTDTIRIGKFLVDPPKGPLFIAKQVGLQLSNPKLETRKGITGFFQSQPTRIYNLGLNTIAQIPVNAFGGHFNRHGILPVQSENTKYINVVQFNNENGSNRLLGYKEKFKLGDREGNLTLNRTQINTLNTITGTLNQFLGTNIPPLKPTQLIIDDYQSGPNSVYGIGRTTINRYTFTEDKKSIDDAISRSGDVVKLAVTDLNQNLSRDLVGRGPSSYPEVEVPKIPNNVYGTTKYSDIQKKNEKQQELNKNKKEVVSGSSFYPNQFGIYNTTRDTNGVINNKGNFSSANLGANAIGYKNSYNDTVTIKMPNWQQASREVRIGSGRRDEINLTPMFDGINYFGKDTSPNGKTNDIRDLVRFRIQAIDTDVPNSGTWMVFRAYLTDLSDETSPDWNEVKYAGRGDKFYIYNGFNRKINVSFKIAALSKEEMKFIYQKLNFLMSNAMPDYNGVLMRGPLVRLSIGNWIDCQLGKLDSISFKIPQDSPWEIALDEPEGGTKMLILPHIVEVSLGFTPIGSETRGVNLISEKSTTTSNIAQNNTGDVGNLQYIDSK
jgi:hypothetical protein